MPVFLWLFLALPYRDSSAFATREVDGKVIRARLQRVRRS